MTGFELPPITALLLFVGACLAGQSYRRVWKEEGPSWQLWFFGATAALLLCTVAFFPIAVG
ncbi:MAG: hypothetical protein AAF280_05340 [Pseudomonadota bacterium]